MPPFVCAVLESLRQSQNAHALLTSKVRDRACHAQRAVDSASAHAAAVHRVHDDLTRIRIETAVLRPRGVRQSRVHPPASGLTFTCREHALARDGDRLAE